MKPDLQLLKSEKDALKGELVHLKNCQLQYFTLSVTSTGVLLSLGSKLGASESPALFYLAPLIIILPCWWIFFDKATTITRGVGYLQVLETIMYQPEEKLKDYEHLGWENALAKSRESQRYRHSQTHSDIPEITVTKLLFIAIARGLTFKSSHLYWTLNWYTFFGLSLICWLLGNGVLNSRFLASSLLSFKGIFPTVIIIISSFYNLYLLGDLIGGKRSYDAAYKAWKHLLLKPKQAPVENRDSPKPAVEQ